MFISSVGVLALAPPISANLLVKLDPVELTAYQFLTEFLTGIPVASLSPVIAPDNIKPEEVYLAHLRNGFGEENVSKYLATFLQKNRAQAENKEIADAIFLRTSSVFKAMSRVSLKMWMLGMWFGANETKTITNESYQKDMVISGRAYSQALAWRIGQGNPPGASNLVPANWSSKPDSAP